MTTPFNDGYLREWFFEGVEANVFAETVVSNMGAGPFTEEDFDDFLYRRGVTVYVNGPETEVLVVGREDWREDDLNELLEKRAGRTLKVYSQEMMVAYLASGRDPFDDEEAALRFGEGHPALAYLSGVGFDWPKTYVAGGDGSFVAELPPVGLLKYVGYKVGRNGLGEAERRAILQQVFHAAELPAVSSASYMREWGGPRSGDRLLKMANSIAAFCRNEKRKLRPSEEAVSDWEDDLEWLRKTYYRGRFRFQWPSSSVR